MKFSTFWMRLNLCIVQHTNSMDDAIFRMKDSSIKEMAIIYYKFAKEKHVRAGHEFDRFEFPIFLGEGPTVKIGEGHVYQGILKWVWVLYPDGSKRQITIDYNHEVK